MKLASDLTEHKYPAIARAALEMSYANGGINRDRSEADVLTDLGVTIEVIGGFVTPNDLSSIDAWLAMLGEDDLLTAVDGEQSETAALIAEAPSGAPRAFGQAVLNAIFHGVA